ncbi:Rieske (2Fe-2S) protein [Halococcus qingdaonensis]|uniref:Rieske (2Fe-2S) protein n=1 Tax=Halococcus qingdaonensis TaxID=224402 RepID=UPI002116BBA1|nr:non-heme iron oxygenase ferredoxin subunit [Halococcus qingdaonensis]
MTDFVSVATTDELDDGEGTVVETNGHTIALFRVEGDFYAIGNECTHEGGPLGEGDLDGTTVTCPWHGARFDVTSGKVLEPPADDSEPEYEVHIDGDTVRVGV